MDKNNNQEMLMDWEKQMMRDVAHKVKAEIDEKKKRNESSPIRIVRSDISYKLEQEKRIEEEVKEYRKQHTLSILEKCGLDLNEFIKSSLYTSPRLDLMLEHIQGKIDGYDLTLTTHVNKNGSMISNIRERIPNLHPIDTSRMVCTLANDTLIIESNDIRYEYSQDEHYLIYLNGEVVVTHKKIHTKEEIRKWERDLHENMESGRIASEENMQKSLEFAKKFRVR